MREYAAKSVETGMSLIPNPVFLCKANAHL